MLLSPSMQSSASSMRACAQEEEKRTERFTGRSCVCPTLFQKCVLPTTHLYESAQLNPSERTNTHFHLGTFSPSGGGRENKTRVISAQIPWARFRREGDPYIPHALIHPHCVHSPSCITTRGLDQKNSKKSHQPENQSSLGRSSYPCCTHRADKIGRSREDINYACAPPRRSVWLATTPLVGRTVGPEGKGKTDWVWAERWAKGGGDAVLGVGGPCFLP